MEPVLTLIQSPLCHSQSPVPGRKANILQTTPKLPRRERLASFSRLVGSENFLELIQDATKFEGRRLRKLERNFNSERIPDIHISEPSPHRQELIPEKGKSLIPDTIGWLDSNLLPFSPSFLNCKSPNYLSPNYKQPTPTRSPLYNTPESKTFLGRGSFGNVTLCSYKGSQFALKLAHKNGTAVGEKNFLGIRHPHLVRILHVTQVLDKIFICMDFAGHCNLQQVLDTKSELDFPRRLSFCIQIISGLQHCHQHRIVHGDVKPTNVIVSPYGICKLGDFGHSISMGHEPLVQQPLPTEEIIGTVPYAAPEVLRGARPVLASDIYSFGILLWQVQTREFPFAGEHPHVIIYKVAHYGCRPAFVNTEDDISRSFSETAQLCWCDDPSKRLTASNTQKVLGELMMKIKLKNISLSKSFEKR